MSQSRFSTPQRGLKVVTVTSVEQTHIPTSIIADTPFLGHGPILLYANTNVSPGKSQERTQCSDL